jgi:RNA polymerase sigma factor (sigma-70 family)
VLRAHPGIVEVLLSAAHRHMGNTADAEDLFQETLRIALERDDLPDPRDPEAVRRFLGSIMNGEAVNRRRADRRHAATLYDDEGISNDAPNHSATLSAHIPNPERALLESENEAQRQAIMAAIRDALAGDPIAQQMFDLAEAGTRGSTEFAKRIGCTTDDIYRAQRRITRHALKVAANRAEHSRRAS